jgi:Tfp pilus assembly protein PilO
MKKISINLKDPRLRIPVLVTLLTGGAVYYWYSQMFTPLLQDQSNLKKQLIAKQDTLRIIQALKPQLAQLRNELAAAQHHLDSLKSIFPDQKEIPKLIREITSVARASGISTTRFNPMPDVEREYYIENRYSIAVEGGYHDLAEFFAFLANFTLIINLSSVNISGNSAYPTTPTETLGGEQIPTVKALFEMTTFSSKR